MMPVLVAATLAAVSSASPTFASVTLGETVQQLLEQRGDPLRVFDRQGVLEYVYLTPSGNALEFVRIEDGNVIGAEVVTSPPYSDGPVRQSALGIQLGDKAQVLAAFKESHAAGVPDDMMQGDGPFRGHDGLDYYFSAGLVVTGIGAYLPLDQRRSLHANPVAPVVHSGSSLDDAIVIKADSDDVGVRAEYQYLSYHSCSRYMGARVQQALINRAGRAYDKLTVANCSQSNANGEYYFDISDFFGKI